MGSPCQVNNVSLRRGERCQGQECSAGELMLMVLASHAEWKKRGLQTPVALPLAPSWVFSIRKQDPRHCLSLRSGLDR